MAGDASARRSWLPRLHTDTQTHNCAPSTRRNLLVLHTSALVVQLVQLDHRLAEEHVEPDERPVHGGEDELVAAGRVAALQHAGLQFERALLLPLGLGGLLRHARRVFLLAQLDDGVHVAGAVLALAP